MHKFGLHGSLQAQPGKGGELSDLMLEAARLVAQENGCHLYIISRGEQEPDTLWITEVWDTEADHNNSLRNADIRALIGRAMPLLATMPSAGQRLHVAGGLGLPD